MDYQLRKGDYLLTISKVGRNMTISIGFGDSGHGMFLSKEEVADLRQVLDEEDESFPRQCWSFGAADAH